MKDTVKLIIADYIKIPAEQINDATKIGRSALLNSIMVHRMYAALAKEGFPINNYQEIKTYGDLVNEMSEHSSREMFSPVFSGNNYYPLHTNNNNGIGVDMEDISNLPVVNDFRDDEFYKMNFTEQEIAYCGLQPDPYASFAGLFAVKEAITKADDFYINVPFCKIFIDHLPDGKPVFDGFQISISHTKILAIAVAHKYPALTSSSSSENSLDKLQTPPKEANNFLSIFAVILAAIALLLFFFR